MKTDTIMLGLMVAEAYLAKAVADDLMKDCVRPPRYGLNLVTAAIAERKAERKRDKTRKLYDIRFRRLGRSGYVLTWQRWATDAQEARASAIKALEQEYPEGFRIVAVEEAT